MSTRSFLDYAGLRHFKEKLETLFATKASVTTVNNRIDNLIDITQSGDATAAEVADMRIGYDSAVYTSAGSAMRAMGTDFDDRITALENADVELDPDDFDLEQDPDDNKVYVTYQSERCGNGIVIVGTGGGGGSGGGNNAVITVTNTTGWLSRTITSGAACSLSVSWSSVEDETPTGSGTMTVTVGGITKLSQNVAQGSVTVNVADYLTTGTNKIKLKITDVYDNAKTITFTVNVVALTISSYFTTANAFTAGNTIAYTYTPVGNVEKTVYFVIDGGTASAITRTTTVTASGSQQSYTLPALTHGAHTLLVYFTAVVDGDTVTSNELYYALTVVDPESTDVIIASSFRGTTVSQYETISIPYTVYSPSGLTAEVSLYAKKASDSDYVKLSDLTVGRTEQTWSYRADETGTLNLMITSGSVAHTIALTVTSAGIDIEPVTTNLSLYLTSYGRMNTEAHPEVWEDTDNNVSCTLSNFNFASDGWVQDNDGITVLRVSGDARVTIPYQPFADNFIASGSLGKTIEIEYATRDVMNYDATAISCLSNGCGFRLTAQNATIASQSTSLGTQYKEDEHVRVSFVVEPTTAHRLIYIYLNGVMSGVIQYANGDSFSQSPAVDISIGSNYCTTDIYNIRVYDTALERHDIVTNWIADTQDVETMLERYTHNDVYDAYKSITIENLPADLPYLVLSCAELPPAKGQKRTVSGYYVDPVDASKSFSFDGASADVQGTSSQGYPRKNYKIKFNGGFTMTSTGETASTYALRSDTVPTKTFTFKADYASSEGANNVELVRLYNDTCPYKTPAQIYDEENDATQLRRQGIDGLPIVIFWNNTSDNTTTFVGKYNFNLDKGTEECYGFEDGDESWEIKNNTGNRVIWKSDDYSGTGWLDDFEGRYPDGNTDPTNLSALASWLVTTDQSAATGNALASSYTDVDGVTHTVDNAAYRLAKFKTEAWDHLEKDSTIFYYLFTELFLMVDSRAKNAFPTLFTDDGKWSWLPYDFDTAIGINNEGALVFDYSLEDIDQVSGGDVFNGQNSVLWVNLRGAFYNEIMEMYQDLRSSGALSYDVVEQMFEDHQSKWPEAIFNEDSYFKYIEPLITSGTDHLDMAQGNKAEQRKWWLYNRFRYMDSKYNAGDAQRDFIMLRAYAKDDITVTAYASIYASVKYGSYFVTSRSLKNVATTLENPLDTLNDTEIFIYSAPQLSSIGDLSGLKVGQINISAATKLQSLKLGDASSSYDNKSLYALSFGNNVLLQTLDVRNCSGLGDTTIDGHNQTAVDISNCTNIEHVYFDGTYIKSLALPNGGILKTLSLPGTITSLVIQNQPSISTFNVGTVDIAKSATYTSGTIDAEGAEDTSSADFRSGYLTAKGNVTYTAGYDTSDVSAITVYEYSYDDTIYTFIRSTTVLNGGTITTDASTAAVRIVATASSAEDAAGVELRSSPYSNIGTLRLEGTGTAVPYLDILREMQPGSYVRLMNFVMTASTKAQVNEFVGILDSMVGITDTGSTTTIGEAVKGTITGLGPVTLEWVNSIISRYPNITIEYESATGLIQQYLERTMTELESDSIEAIGRYAFYNRTEFTTATISATSIGTYAFANSGLTTLDLTSTEPVTIAANAFNGASDFQHLIIRSESVSALVDTSAFVGTKIGQFEGAIYVPAALLDDYKEATNWSTYAGLIHPIEAYPLTDFSTITDSWEDIFAAELDGTYSTKYAVGDSKSLDIDGTTVYMRVAALDTDVLASDNTQTAKITWIAQGFYGTHRMNASNTTTGGWPATEMRSWLISTVLPKLPTVVQNNIKTVTKTYYDYASTSTLTSDDSIWIPSNYEVRGGTEESGVWYSTLFPNDAGRIKYNSSGSAAYWWTRSANSATYFYYVYSSGSSTSYNASNSYGVVLGFCT